MNERERLKSELDNRFPWIPTGPAMKQLTDFILEDRKRTIKEYKTVFFCDCDSDSTGNPGKSDLKPGTTDWNKGATLACDYLNQHNLTQFLTGWGINQAAKLSRAICEKYGTTPNNIENIAFKLGQAIALTEKQFEQLRKLGTKPAKELSVDEVYRIIESSKNTNNTNLARAIVQAMRKKNDSIR